MPMPLPEERVYYFELRECGNVLLCWIPRSELATRVKSGELDKEILKDHPGGLDVEVTPADLGYLKKRYGLALGVEPEDLLLAFEALTRSKQVKVTGEVSGKLVEELARREQGEAAPDWDARLPISKDQAELVLKKNPVIQRRMDAGLRSLIKASGGGRAASYRRGSKRKATRKSKGKARAAVDIVLPKIRRTKGDPPAMVFGRLQRQVKGGK